MELKSQKWQHMTRATDKGQFVDQMFGQSPVQKKRFLFVLNGALKKQFSKKRLCENGFLEKTFLKKQAFEKLLFENSPKKGGEDWGGVITCVV